MNSMQLTMPSGQKVAVTVSEAANGEVAVTHAVISAGVAAAASHTITCTCSSTGKSTTKQCPTTSALCDCSDPKNPKITCN